MDEISDDFFGRLPSTDLECQDTEAMIERLRAVAVLWLGGWPIEKCIRLAENQTQAKHPRWETNRTDMHDLAIALRALQPGDLGPQCEWTKEA